MGVQTSFSICIVVGLVVGLGVGLGVGLPGWAGAIVGPAGDVATRSDRDGAVGHLAEQRTVRAGRAS